MHPASGPQTHGEAVKYYLCAVNYNIIFGIFSALTGLGLFFYNLFAPLKATHPLSWLIWGIFVVVTWLIHYLLTRPGKTTQQFVRMFMGLTSLKLFGFLMFLVLYALIETEGAFVFVLHFLVFYLLYTVFEVITLYKHFAPKR